MRAEERKREKENKEKKTKKENKEKKQRERKETKKMKTEELMERIHMPEEARELACRKQISEEEYGIWKERFYQDIRQFIEVWKKTENRYVWALEFYLKLAVDAYEEYRRRGYADQIFDQTFYDITIWCEECRRKHGVYGLEELWWLGQSVKLKLFRLGRLQFEPILLEHDMEGRERTVKAGTKVLNVHIPSGEPLRMEACKDSFEKAEDFFGEEYQVYVCDSWLLSPHLKEILPDTSNIIRFQNLFEVTRVGYEYPQAEQRIFEVTLEDKSQYPEDTFLRKKAKAYVLSGKDLGIGEGFFYRRRK